jgi:DNA sulfur modification protein DndC
MNFDLFQEQEQEQVGVQTHTIHMFSKEEPEERASRRIREVLLAGHPGVLAFSAGKDSSVLAGIALNVARGIIEKGFECPPIVILHGDTGVESPSVSALAKAEIRKMIAYAKKHNFTLRAKINHPKLSASWPVRVIGGRALPAFPDSRSDCTTDWKILPGQLGQKEVFADLAKIGKWKEPVVMTGVRNEESIARDQRIKKRGEVAEGIWSNEFGALRLSPILDFTVDDVWEVIGYANAGVYDMYSDFAETMQIYRDAGSSSCVIVADMKSAGSSKPCGTRTGCWACTRVANDKSMGEMIKSDPERYGNLKPLAELRDFISNTQYNWDLRQWVGRSIDEDGFIAIGPDTYSPEMLEKLLRYTLTAQAKSGVKIIDIAQLIAIDARWSQYGLHPPFTALKIFLEVEAGAYEDAPIVKRYPKTDVPKIGKMFVGAPNFNAAMEKQVSGLRNIGMEIFHESCGYELKTLKDGTIVADLETDDEFSVSAQGASDFLEFIAEEKIAEYCKPECSDWTWGYKTYIEYGTISVAKGRSTQTHEILQRSQWRQQNNLHGQRSRAELEARCDVLFSAQLELV